MKSESIPPHSLRVQLSPDDQKALAELRDRKPARTPAHHHRKGSLGEKVADQVAATVGSWNFVLIQSGILTLWIIANLVAWIRAWDPYPFILLNLVLSFQAAYTAPIIMMAQNRQSVIDRRKAEQDYHVNLKAELEIESLHEKIDLLREQEISRLSKLVEELGEALAKKP
ncbi:MAG: DUF1003 domain-containing protein [Proteobacteria bacterium]|nr:DUF1003 domain-containing protein [Pseudomonadota bacterium]